MLLSLAAVPLLYVHCTPLPDPNMSKENQDTDPDFPDPKIGFNLPSVR